ncbi:cytochrome P450 [Herbihabitans rhizosphaerae]|uniref:Cytochrome P450 n=1 Tax=Herbihabitans rhizosphaerae TaxID=1872711 RepID=A0A4Q7L4E5_9PSEU|nr:cytochrome P450 [Herbihabitans rhizosphaerae]RZS44499.1 cytochrome P450 [Herbihabitans rhizosphaerae]
MSTPHDYPFNSSDGLDLDEEYTKARDGDGMIKVRLPYGEPAWLATRYDDVRLVLGDRRFSRAAAAERDEPRSRAGRQRGGILAMDPPDHTRLRVLAAKAFTVRRVEQLRPRVREVTAELITAMRDAGPPVDLVDSFALPLPVRVICELLGVPTEDQSRFRVWSDAALSTSSLSAEEFVRNQRELREYMAGLIAQRRARPEQDFMTALIQARDVDDKLSEKEMIDLCAGILVAGHETTATQIPNFVYLLTNHPDRMAELRANPDRIPAAVEELLRYVPLGSGSGFARYATEDVEVGGVLVRAGEPVLVSIGSANRDERKFAAPDEMSFHRESNSHMGFGHGAHHCLGAPLARVELQEALRGLLAELPGLHVAGDIEWKSHMVVRGPRRMPVAW